jgi:hypothetical protein
MMARECVNFNIVVYPFIQRPGLYKLIVVII